MTSCKTNIHNMVTIQLIHNKCNLSMKIKEFIKSYNKRQIKDNKSTKTSNMKNQFTRKTRDLDYKVLTAQQKISTKKDAC